MFAKDQDSEQFLRPYTPVFSLLLKTDLKLETEKRIANFWQVRQRPDWESITTKGNKKDWPGRIRALSDGAGVDFVYNCISSGATVADTAKTLAPDGKMAVVRSREGGAWTADRLVVEPSYGATWKG
ncbi:hypothetical protein MMC13_000744 [Lambiella insularis]|nr:hypothetical protein [Lambiella insularis]